MFPRRKKLFLPQLPIQCVRFFFIHICKHTNRFARIKLCADFYAMCPQRCEKNQLTRHSSHDNNSHDYTILSTQSNSIFHDKCQKKQICDLFCVVPLVIWLCFHRAGSLFARFCFFFFLCTF